MANGGFGRKLAVLAAVTMAGLRAGFTAQPSVSGKGIHVVPEPAERVDVGRWSYAQKGKRTAAQQKRAARKKRNRARHK